MLTSNSLCERERWKLGDQSNAEKLAEDIHLSPILQLRCNSRNLLVVTDPRSDRGQATD